MPKAFSDQEKEKIREQFREKGKKLFEKYGLRKTSIDQLTEVVGISKGAFYLFFDSKEELFLEILEQIEKDIQTNILEFAIKPKTDSRQNLKNLLLNFLVTWDDYPLLKNLNKNDFDYLLRKIPTERAMKHANNDVEFSKQLLKKIKSEKINISASPNQISNLMKSLFFLGLHREELGNENYKETMNILTDLVAGYIIGE
jgi:AcrR family transcriptional regulator